LKMLEAMAKIIFDKENRGLGKRSRKKTIKMPIFSIEERAFAYSFGKMAVKTRPPSSGGMGIKLNTAKIKLS